MGNFKECGSHRFRSENSNNIFDIEEEKEPKNKELGLKIHILGNLAEKDNIMRDIFKNSISNKRYKSMGTNEYKTEQFYWIARNYTESSKEIIQKICEEIQNDTEKNVIKFEKNIILYFGSENFDLLLEKLKQKGDIYFPLIIIITEKKINSKTLGYIDLRKITNIVLNDKTSNRINSIIISQLWESDCYFNERGNKLCRYTPDNIFKALNINLSFYSINILLTGKSRAGKSTFINFLSNKLVALESSKKESVSQKITEYCLELDSNNSKHSIIKLFDTPGIIPEPKKLNECKQFLQSILENKDNNMEKQIHFILFFFNEGDNIEGIDEIFELLNDCQKPVLFIINRAFDETDNGNTKDIKATICYLTQKKFEKLINPKNYFGVNIVKTKKSNSFGVEEIFKRIHEIYKEKNAFNEEIDNRIEKLYKKYEDIYEKPKEMQTKEKDKYEFEKEVSELKKDVSNKLDMYKNLDINQIIQSGKKSVNKCRKVINSLGNISNIFQKIDNFIPAISFFQAFMVIEIGEIFGFNLKEMDKEIREYLNNLKENLKDMDILNYEKIKDSKGKKIKISNEIIEKQLQTELEKSNKKIIKQLAEYFQNLRQNGIKLYNYTENNVDEPLTNGICEECQEYLINLLRESEGVIFVRNYMKICKQLEKDLESFSNLSSEDDWGKKEIILIEE